MICPKCGSEMRIRNGTFGFFYGCIRYPKCRKTLPYPNVTKNPLLTILKLKIGKYTYFLVRKTDE